MKKIDAHIYYDQKKTDLYELSKLNKKDNFEFIISASPTETSEPNKSKFMYFLQSYIFSNIYFHKLAKYISSMFYDENYELKKIFKIFTGFKNYKKVSVPKNKFVITNIKNHNYVKMWLWLNPNNTISMEDLEALYHDEKVAGVKFHMYWHNLKAKDMIKVIEKNFLNKPIYIILNYSPLEEINKIIKKYKKTNFIFGYGGFPHYENLWKYFSKFENVYIDTASLHLNPFHILKIFRYFKKEKIIFSSDYPYNFQVDNKFSYKLFEKRFENIDLKNYKDLFYYKNIDSLIN